MSLESESAENVSTENSVRAIVDTHDDGDQADEVKVAQATGGTGTDETTGPSASQTAPLSKNQIKKLKKKERWQQIKAKKRHAEKEKKKKRFAELKERGEEIGPSRKSLKKNRMVDSACRQRVVIDCSFDTYMTEKDTTFLVQQIQHSYAANRRAENPLQLYICGLGGKAKQRLDNIGDYKGWDMHKEERDFTEVFPKEEIVYLSSESPNVLEGLDDSKVYVIGGLVDHNHHKGLCHQLAEERGLAHAQLPIGQFLQLKSRKVLTINHVFEILLRFTESQNWQTSLLSVLPQRKGVCVKAGQGSADSKQCQNTQTHSAQAKGEATVIDERQEALQSVVNGSEVLSISGSGAESGVSQIDDSLAECTVKANNAMEVAECTVKANNAMEVAECTVKANNVMEESESVCSRENCRTEGCTDVTDSEGGVCKEIAGAGHV